MKTYAGLIGNYKNYGIKSLWDNNRVDEFRMVSLNVINTVLKRFLTAPRQPGYLNNPKYADKQERNKEIYMSSAWLLKFCLLQAK